MKANFKKLLSLALALIMILALVACGGDPANNTTTNNNTGNQTDDTDSGEEKLAAEQVFGFFLNNEPENLDPWVNNNGEASQIIAAVHEPMLRRDSEGGWIPGLMTDYQTNEDHTVHTLTLREGAKWSDGTDITVEDIVYSYQRALDPELGSAIAYRYFPIRNAEAFYKGEVGADELGVKAVDDKTIEITTAEPCDFFVDMMTSAGFAPIQKAAGEKYGDLYGTDVDKVVSSGPFVLTEWTHKNSMVLEKNENYWDAENVKLERVDVTITADTNTLTGLYHSGELGVMRVSNDMLDVYAGENIVTNSRMKVTFIEFNPNNEFLSNKNIREAFSIAFNRTLMAEQIMGNGDLAAYGLVPPGVLGLDGGDFREQAGNVVTDANDPAEIEHAQELLQTGLDELGKTVEDLQNGFSIQCLSGGQTQAQAIQNMWKTNLGVEMPVSVLDMNVLLPMLMEGTFDCVIGGGQDSDYRDPQGFMQFIYDEGKWDNEEFRSLVELAHTQVGNERIQTWMDIEKMVLENFIYIPQLYAENNWAVAQNVRGVEIYNYGYEIDFKNVYIVE